MPFWTPEADQFITDCAERGLSANITATMLGGGRTRNAIIGRAHRIGVAFHSGNNAWSREAKPRGKYKEREKKPKKQRPSNHGTCNFRASSEARQRWREAVRLANKKRGVFQKGRITFGSGFTKSDDSMKTLPITIEPAPLPANLPRRAVRGAADAVQALKAHMCRWPIGDPQEKDFRFCGVRVAWGKSYCPHHHHYSHSGGGGYGYTTSIEEA